MKRTVLPLGVVALLFAPAPGTAQDLQNILGTAGQILGGGGGTGALSNEEVVRGLKQALEVGSQRSVDLAGRDGGFWDEPRIRIPFPAEAEKVRSTLLGLGMNKPVEDFERTLNKAAETAVKEAVPVFVDAITGLSVEDGFSILKGGPDAATNLLRQRTTEALTTRFRPIVEQATAKVALTGYWTPLANAYNSAALFTGGKAVDPDLNAYVTDRAIAGLFTLLADEERKIRQDPVARTTELLQRVFGN
ncbi:MAG: DUF4197 domain-containing protein [Flavobacteriales bacterium]|nr:hypothetical protein [Flavobacteriales bacterium]MCC6576202.1 DUF4197 domain-containing protein [Flavobacteriales bacterium]NUQ14968.1 DUF4197 domain-containing protein [Flavobacteriales bacterium]